MSATYVVRIAYYENLYDSNGNVIGTGPKEILLGSVEAISVSLSSDLTTHPVASGDMIADHSIKKPCSLTIRGVASRNGSNDVYIAGSYKNEQMIEKTFEDLKRNAYLCSITKWNLSADTTRFRSRSNMVLTSIGWTEGINTLGFDLGFDEVFITSSVDEVAYTDEDSWLPDITEAVATSFSESLMDWEYIAALVPQICKEEGLLKPGFDELWKASSTELGIAAGAAIAGAGAAVAGGIGIAVAAAAGSGPPGWAILAVAAAVALQATKYYFIYKAISNAITAYKDSKKFKLKTFEVYQDDEKNRQEVERFAEFVGEVYLSLRDLGKYFQTYKISSNTQQDCLVTLGNESYVFSFKKNNVVVEKPAIRNPKIGTSTLIRQTIKDDAPVSSEWYVDVYDQSNVLKCTKSVAVAQHSFDACTSTNCLFRTSGSGLYVYLCTNGPVASTQDLTNYYIVATKIKPETFMDMINEAIRNAFMY